MTGTTTRAARRRRRTATALAVALGVTLLGCAGDGGGTSAPPTSAPPTTATATIDADAVADACPAAYRDEAPATGTHDGFTSSEQERAFHLLLPDGDPVEPFPLFVALTGTVQEEQAFLEQSGLDQLPASGWAVVAPVRNDNGLIWKPWDAMRTPQMTSPNPDEDLVVDLVRCLSAHHDVDPDRVFVGGISIGGTFTNYLLRRHSDLFAGGIVGSGNFVLTEPADPEPLDPMTVIVAWGGETDVWTGCPDGRMGAEYAGEPGCVTAEFVADASRASQYYASEAEVRHIACSEDVGHIWITHATPYWAGLLASLPKGDDVTIDLGEAPPPMTCTTEPYVR